MCDRAIRRVVQITILPRSERTGKEIGKTGRGIEACRLTDHDMQACPPSLIAWLVVGVQSDQSSIRSGGHHVGDSLDGRGNNQCSNVQAWGGAYRHSRTA